MAKVGRGEIWQFAFPRPDHRRPVLVLTRQDMIGRLHTVTVARRKWEVGCGVGARRLQNITVFWSRAALSPF